MLIDRCGGDAREAAQARGKRYGPRDLAIDQQAQVSKQGFHSPSKLSTSQGSQSSDPEIGRVVKTLHMMCEIWVLGDRILRRG